MSSHGWSVDPTKLAPEDFEPVIGLEVHCQLSTDTKIFCACRARLPEGASVADEGVNANTCPVCAGHPGTLPALNKRVVEFAVKAGLATHCEIRLKSVFSRKNYFYPDLPKGYQISQYDLPICEKGWLPIEFKGPDGKVESRRIPLQRIHLEEDAGKNIHATGFSLVNLNRAGMPLIEIVSGPDMRSSDEAGAYLRALHAVVTYLEICDGNMQEGNFRCDANVSVRPKGQEKFGTRAEIKNVNSFRFVEKAIEFEIARQVEVLRSGGRIVQETRLYDSQKNSTFSMRSKEEAQDYRYFPEPDLLPLTLDAAWVEQLRGKLPELPEQKKQRYVKDLALTPYDAGVLTGSKALATFFERSLAELGADAAKLAKPVANLLTGEVARLCNDEGIDVDRSNLKPGHVAELAKLTQAQTVSSTGAKAALVVAWKSGEAIDAIVKREGLAQVSDTSALLPAIDEVIAANPGQVADFKGGKDKLIGFFVGQVMKKTGGKANPALLQDLVRNRILGKS